MRPTIGLTLLLAGCVTGPKTERKKQLEILNGENYQVSPGNVGPVAIPLTVERRARVTKVAGKVRTGTDAFSALPPRLEVALVDARGQEMERTMTDAEGKFSFARVMPNGSYAVRSNSKALVGEIRFDVTSFDVPDLLLLVR